jgi:hypothetical protein
MRVPVQILEVTEIGLRSAVIRLKHREKPMQFLIFPMLHMAHEGFYRELAMAEVMPSFDDALGGDRDKRLLEAVIAMYAERADEDITIGVVYGAAHVRRSSMA